MGDIAIRGERLGKRYRIGQRQPYLALRDILTQAAKAPLRALRASASKSSSNGAAHIWALKDVSFEVREGEVVGIIGRNGAGKSTLLKILARVTKPTEGFAKVHGRLSSLLEVGTGFHPELTGRENVYLSGAILGMKKREIVRKFDEIVAFADVEEFIDTPLKHYSSGMQMRLAFAVAAHLEPEILLVDEVLAVGDTAFQKKCLGKMGEVAGRGRTILFVSHNFAAVTHLCTRAIYVSGGGIRMDGETELVTGRYLREVLEVNSGQPFEERTDRKGDGKIRFVGLHFEDANGQATTFLRSGEDCSLALQYRCPDGKGKRSVVVSFAIKNHLGTCLIHHRTNFSNQNFEFISPTGTFVCRIPKLPLTQGQYSINVFVGINEVPCDSIEDAAHFSIETGDFFGTGHQAMPSFCRLLTKCDWDLRTAPSVEAVYLHNTRDRQTSQAPRVTAFEKLQETGQELSPPSDGMRKPEGHQDRTLWGLKNG